MKPIVKRYPDFESTLASILYNREYTGPIETEEDIEKSFGSYLELAKKLAPDLMEKARREMLIEQETTENKRLNLDE
jgi:hypothetical protein